MTRSIHTTRRDLRELERADFADEAHKQRRIARVKHALEMKHAIKARVRQPGPEAEMAVSGTPVDADSIPIEVRDQQEHVHYPASVADLRAVMRRLPPGILDGLSRIVLTLGADYMREQAESGEGYGDPDPLVGRIGVDGLPGVYVGAYSGTYFGADTSIWLYAYVYDASIMPDREVREHWLRLQMLSTLVHELAHHHDHTACDARGRWSTRPKGRREWSARKQEFAWTIGYIVPYLESHYSAATTALVEWVRTTGGVTLPLAKLINHPDESLFYTEGAVVDLLRSMDNGELLQEARRDFARNLHYADRFDEALVVIAAILAEHPDDHETCTLQADIYEHQERYDEAEAVAKMVVNQNPANLEAWDVLLEVYRAQGRWRELDTAASHVIALEDGKPADDALIERACARLELGDIGGAGSDVQRLLEQHKRRRRPGVVESLRAWFLLRIGRYEDALRVAQERLPPGRQRLPWCGVLIAVRYEAAHRLSRPQDAGTVSARAAELLRHFGHGAWLDRLKAEYGLRVWSKNHI